MASWPACGFREISELIQLHTQYPSAFEASLIDRGLRWRDIATEDLTWSDCWAVIDNLPYDDPLMRAINGKEWFWYNPMFDVVTGIYDGLSQLVAVVTRRPGIKRSEVPKRTRRPWDKNEEVEILKVKPSKIADLRKLLGWDK